MQKSWITMKFDNLLFHKYRLCLLIRAMKIVQIVQIQTRGQERLIATSFIHSFWIFLQRLFKSPATQRHVRL